MASELSEHERVAVATATFADPVRFLRFFLPHLFSTEIPWIHRGTLAILTKQTKFLLSYGDLAKIQSNFVAMNHETGEEFPIFRFASRGRWIEGEELDGTPVDQITQIDMRLGKNTLIMLPRGFSKTTLVGLGFPIYVICFQLMPFLLYVSETGPHARMQLNNVQRELSGNERLLAIFGPQKPKLSDDEKWSQELFETITGISMAARGRGAQVRGINHKGQRPSMILCDDLEDRESVDTDLQRMKARTWAYGDLIPAIAELDPSATMVALGTLLHQEALLQVWSKDPIWTVIKFSAKDRQGDFLWPYLMDQEKYEAKKKSFSMAGMLQAFYLEYENEYRAPELALVKAENIHIFVPKDEVIGTALYLDPAISDEPDADHSFMVVASMTESGMIRVRDFWYKVGAHPREQVDQYFIFSKAYQPNKHGVETNAFQRALVHTMNEEMARNNWYFEIDKVTHAQKKDFRIRGILGPRFGGNYISFDRPMPELITQLLDYPSGRVDGPDALAGAIALLDSYAGQAQNPEDPGTFDDEYEPIEKVVRLPRMLS